MIHEETVQKLLALRLHAMAAALRELAAAPPGHALTFEETLGMIVDREWTARDNRRLAKRLRDAHLLVNGACVEDVRTDPTRGLDKATIRSLGTCQWVRAKQNVIAVGATGTGKSFLAAALAQAACRLGLRALCVRVPRFVHDLAIARGDGSFTELLQRLAKIDVLVLDDFLVTPLSDPERRDILEVLEDRYGCSSTVITTQLPTKSWHEALVDPTIAEAICDRVVHNAHVVTLRGPSMRKQKGLGQDQKN